LSDLDKPIVIILALKIGIMRENATNVSQDANEGTRAEKYATSNKHLKTANICSLNRNCLFLGILKLSNLKFF